jgi:hypothetical protein
MELAVAPCELPRTRRKATDNEWAELRRRGVAAICLTALAVVICFYGAASGSVSLLFGAVGALLGLLFVRVALETHHRDLQDLGSPQEPR